MGTKRTMRGQVAIAGVGETTYYKHGQSPDAQFALTLKAILAAAEDAGIDPRDIDGIASYADDKNPPDRIAAALGMKRLRFSNMVWGGGGGGGSGAIGNAAMAIHAGVADCVVVFRGLAQGQSARFGSGAHYPTAIAGSYAMTIPYGVMSPAQMFAMRTTRLMHDHGISRSTLRAVSMASSLRCYGPVSRGDCVRLRHQHAIAASKAPQSFRLRNAPLAFIDVAVAIRVHLLERRLEARRHQQILEVRLAAVDEEVDHLLVGADGVDDLLLLERARVVLVDHAEDLARRRQEVEAELEVVLARGAVPALALPLEVLEALGEAPVDRALPCVQINR